MNSKQAVVAYKEHLRRCFDVIFSARWWEGSYEKVVGLMDKLWPRLGERGQEEVVAYGKHLYQTRISPCTTLSSDTNTLWETPSA